MSTEEAVYLRDIAFKGDLVATASGDLDTIAGRQNVHDALLRRLVTAPGSLIHRPDYGVGINRYQNSLGGLETRRRLAALIKDQFERDDRVDEVVAVSFSADDQEPEKTEIKVRVKLVGLGEQAMIFTPFEGN